MSSTGFGADVEVRTIYLPLLSVGERAGSEELLPQQTGDGGDPLHLPDIMR